MDQEGISCY